MFVFTGPVQTSHCLFTSFINENLILDLCEEKDLRENINQENNESYRNTRIVITSIYLIKLVIHFSFLIYSTMLQIDFFGFCV
mgnify:CR=1 FL=1